MLPLLLGSQDLKGDISWSGFGWDALQAGVLRLRPLREVQMNVHSWSVQLAPLPIDLSICEQPSSYFRSICPDKFAAVEIVIRIRIKRTVRVKANILC